MSVLDGRQSFPIILNDIHYEIDLRAYRRNTIEATRLQQDQGSESSEQTLNSQYLWKRSGNSFDYGTGQEWFDFDETASRRRYEASLNVNPWEEKQLSLLPKVTKRYSPAFDGSGFPKFNPGVWFFQLRNSHILIRNTRTGTGAIPDGFQFERILNSQITHVPWTKSVEYQNNVTYTAGVGNIAASSTGGGLTPGATAYVEWAAFDGTTIYFVLRNKNHVFTFSEDSSGQFVIGQIGSNHHFHNLIVVGGKLFATHNTGTVVDFCEITTAGRTIIASYPVASAPEFLDGTVGPDGYYFAAANTSSGSIQSSSNVKSFIYRCTISDTSVINSPSVISQLPEGEIIFKIEEYAGYILIGTSLGFRLAQYTSTGGINYGPLIQITPDRDNSILSTGDSGHYYSYGFGVKEFATQGRYVWFNWDDYRYYNSQYGHGGLGRIDLGQLTNELTPAYSTDLMVLRTDLTASNVTVGSDFSVQGISQYKDRIYFVTDFAGFGEYDGVSPPNVYVDEGYISIGKINYGTTELKQFSRLDSSINTVDGGTDHVTFSFNSDNSATTIYGQIGDGEDNQFLNISALNGQYGRINYTLHSSTDHTVTPSIDGWALRSLPVPERQEEIYLPIILKDNVTHNFNNSSSLNAYNEFQTLRALMQSRVIVPLTMGDETVDVIVDSIITGQDQAARMDRWNFDESWIDGIWYVKVITISATGIPATPTVYNNLVGPMGFQGFQGPTGVQGPIGFPGINITPTAPVVTDILWADTTVASFNYTGPQGPTGPQGSQGFQGNQGFQGSQGFQGFQGNQGVVGAQGNQGVAGPQGFQGFQGNQGPQGNQGFQGFQGNQGNQGPQGFQGNQGFQGPQGFQGSTTVGTAIDITAATTSSTPFTVRSLAGQTANLSEWRNSAGSSVANITPGGLMNFTGASAFVIALYADSGGPNLLFGQTSQADFYSALGVNGGVFQIKSNFNGTRVVRAADGLVFAVRGMATQTNNLQEWQNSSGTALARVTSTGRFVSDQSSADDDQVVLAIQVFS